MLNSTRLFAVTGAVVLCLVMTRGDFTLADDGTEPAAEELVRQMSDFYRGLDNFSVDVSFRMRVVEAGEKQLLNRGSQHVAMARPNQIVLKPIDSPGTVIACEGKQLTVYLPSTKRYLRTDAPDDFDAFLQNRASMLMGGGRITAQLAASDPLAQLTHADCTFTLLEPGTIENVICHRVEASRSGRKLVFWIQQGERPLLRKLEWITRGESPDDETDDETDDEDAYTLPVVTLNNWEVDTELPPETFAINLPEDAVELSTQVVEEDDDDDMRQLRQFGKAIPAGPDAPLASDLVVDKLSYNLRTTVGAYKDVGSRDPAWDEEAIAYLTEVARHFALTEGHKSRNEIIPMAEQLIVKECDDPLIRYCYGAFLFDSGQGEETDEKAARIIEESYKGLVDRGYPAYRCYAAARRIYRRSRELEGHAVKTETSFLRAYKHAVEMIAEDDLETNDGRFILQNVLHFTDRWRSEPLGEFYDNAKAHEETSPWLVNVLGGKYHEKMAWEARGHDFAFSVTEEGWQGFSEHMQKAQQCYQRAWKAAPFRPEAPAEMIGVVTSTGNDPLRDMRLWFDRAVAAQFDYLHSYHAVLHYLQPRWYGDHEMMFQFGLECMHTQRYDTNVPYVFCDALWRIANDTQNPLGTRFYRQPGIDENMRALVQGYVEHHKSTRPDMVNWWKSVLLAFLYSSEQWDDARQVLDELEDQVSWDAANRFPLTPIEIITNVRLHTAPQSEAIFRALALAKDGQREEAIQRMQELLRDDELHSHVRRLVGSHLRGLEWDGAFQAGESLDLTPDTELTGWITQGGYWTREEDGSLKGISGKSGIVLQCTAVLGSNWELTGEVEYGDSPYALSDAGILFYSNDEPRYGITVNPKSQSVAAGPYRNLAANQTPYQLEGKTAPFVIRMQDGVVDAWFGETKVVDAQPFPGWRHHRPIHLAIGAHYRWDNSVLIYRNLKLTPIEAEDE